MIPIAKPWLAKDTKQKILDVIDSGIIAQGPKVSEFENEFAEYVGVKNAIAVNSGTAALHTALLANGITKGDEVITTSFSFIASSNSIIYCNAKPVFADIEPETYNLDPENVLEKITPKTKAILGVHLYGHPFDLKAISEICTDHNLILIEDACQSHGALFDRKMVGGFGTGCFSFYPTKNMTTSEGGIITTDNDDVAEKSRMIRAHGSSERYVHELLGYNYRMTDLSAVIGLSQLNHLDKFNEKRRKNAKYFNQKLDSEKFKLPVEKPGCKHVYHQYTISSEKRDEIIKKFQEKEIGYGIHYPTPIHKQPLYLDLGYGTTLPVSEDLAGKVISIPVHPQLTGEHLDYIVKTLNDL